MIDLRAEVRTDSEIRSSRRSWVDVDSIIDSGVVRTWREVVVGGGGRWRRGGRVKEETGGKIRRVRRAKWWRGGEDRGILTGLEKGG